MQKKLNNLREAAANSSWNECTRITAELLEQLSDRNCILLAAKYVQEYLPTFEEHHPNTSWPRERLNEILKKIEGYEASGSTHFILPDIDSEFDTPGSNGFVKELEVLWELVFSSDRKHDCPDKATSVIGGIIMARLTNNWGRRYTNEWLHWYSSAVHGEGEDGTLVLAQAQFMNDPMVVELATAEWHGVADRILDLLAT
jgi:hypothetical protein